MIVTGRGTFTDPREFVDLDQEFDRWFVDKVQEITGLNLMELGGGGAEQIGERRL